ncbi:S16 family serine protease [Streptomyces sp. ODS28]|uniref:S16 family serine protease n=1 Tax=Streptomyces sp. ODS28 TaxID=3136688 RepID=UPI0031EF7C69
MTPRRRTLAICAVPVVALFVVVAAAPLPFSLAQPGLTADVLGDNKGKPVITISGEGAKERAAKGGGGQLRMTTIAATPPDATVRLPDVVRNWFRDDRAVMPRDAVYPVGDSTAEADKYQKSEMRKSQDVAVKAAMNQLHRSADDVKVQLRLADVGGPSAGLLFSLGIVDKLDGDGSGGSLSGGRTIAGTGTIDKDGKVGAVGGVPLKTRAAKRDGASVFLVPRAECQDAKSGLPKGLRLVPVSTLNGAVDSLKALQKGGKVPSCP